MIGAFSLLHCPKDAFGPRLPGLLEEYLEQGDFALSDIGQRASGGNQGVGVKTGKGADRQHELFRQPEVHDHPFGASRSAPNFPEEVFRDRNRHLRKIRMHLAFNVHFVRGAAGQLHASDGRKPNELETQRRLAVPEALQKAFSSFLPKRHVWRECQAQFDYALVVVESVGQRISPAAPDGVRYPIVDGGLTDWTARLLQDKKERLLTSGIGSEFVCRRYRCGSPPNAF